MRTHRFFALFVLLPCAAVPSCSSPTLALRDLKAIHTVDEPGAEEPSSAEQIPNVANDGTPADAVRYRKEAALYGGFDRLFFQTGLLTVLPDLASWVEPTLTSVDEPEILSVELLIELEGADLEDTALVCRTLNVLGGLLLHDHSPLARRRCAALLGRLGRELPRESGAIELSGADADLRFAALVRQIRRDLGERMLAASEGRRLDEEALALQKRPLIELRALRTSNRTVALQLLAVLGDLLDLDTPEVLRIELEYSCRVLAGDVARRQIAFALEQRDHNEWVRSELATAWMHSEGAAGLAALLQSCGTDDSEPVRRTLIALLGQHTKAVLEPCGALSWLVQRADDDATLSSLDAARLLRSLTGLDLHAGEGWVETLTLQPGN